MKTRINQIIRFTLAIIINLLVLIINISLESCSMLNNNYSTPKVDTPTHWSNNIFIESNVEPKLAISELQWWQNFHDKDLDKLITNVLESNNDINQAVMNIKIAQNLLQKVHDNWVPEIDFSLGNATGNLPPLLDNQLTNFSGFSASYMLNIAKIIQEQKLANLNIERQQAVLNSVQLQIISETVTTYYKLIAAHSELKLYQEEIHDLKLKQNLLNNQLELGAISPVDTTSNQQKILDLEVKLPNIKTNITTLENTLAVLLNQNPQNYPINIELANVTLTNIMPKNIPSSVLQQRPDVIIAEDDLKIAARKIGVAYSNFFPQLSLYAPFGAMNTASLSDMGFSTGGYWLTLLQANLPLLNVTNYENLAQSKNNYHKEVYAYINSMRHVFAEVDDSLAWQNNSAQSLNKAESYQMISEQKFNYAENQYHFGAVGYIDILDAKLNIDEANAYSNQAKLIQLESLINLYQVLGGGYKSFNKSSHT